MPPEVATAIVGTTGALAPLVLWLLRLLHKFISRVIDRLDKIEAAVQSINSDIAGIKPAIALVTTELAPNGGHSLSDKINRIRDQVLILESRGRAAWAADGVATYECDEAGQCVWVSPALCELYGLSYESMLGTGWLSALVNTADRERVWEAWQHAVTTGIPYEDEYRVRNRKTNKEISVRTYTTACKDSRGRVARYFGAVIAAEKDAGPQRPHRKGESPT